MHARGPQRRTRGDGSMRTGTMAGLTFDVEQIQTAGRVIGTLQYAGRTEGVYMDIYRVPESRQEDLFAVHSTSTPDQMAVILGSVTDAVVEFYQQGWRFCRLDADWEHLRETAEVVILEAE